MGKNNDEEVVDVEEVKEDLAVVGKNDEEEVDVEEAEKDLAVGFESDGSVELPGASFSEDLFGKENLGKVKKSRREKREIRRRHGLIRAKDKSRGT